MGRQPPAVPVVPAGSVVPGLEESRTTSAACSFVRPRRCGRCADISTTPATGPPPMRPCRRARSGSRAIGVWRGTDAARSGKPVLLVLDEIQKVRGWSETVKRLWDETLATGVPLRVVLLGSSALLVQAGLTESLTGRFFLHRCMHWGWPECRTAFGWDLDDWLYFGGYPGAAAFADDEQAWRQYVSDAMVETVLSRDVFQLSNITKPVLMRHLFGLAAQYPAQIVSVYQADGAVAGRGQHHHAGPLPAPARVRLPRLGAGAVFRRTDPETRAAAPSWSSGTTP
jgi:hypothetical protein